VTFLIKSRQEKGQTWSSLTQMRLCFDGMLFCTSFYRNTTFVTHFFQLQECYIAREPECIFLQRFK